MAGTAPSARDERGYRDGVIAAADAVAWALTVDAAALLATVERVHTVGAITDPTAYRARLHGGDLEATEQIVGAVRAVQRAVSMMGEPAKRVLLSRLWSSADAIILRDAAGYDRALNELLPTLAESVAEVAPPPAEPPSRSTNGVH